MNILRILNVKIKSRWSFQDLKWKKTIFFMNSTNFTKIPKIFERNLLKIIFFIQPDELFKMRYHFINIYENIFWSNFTQKSCKKKIKKNLNLLIDSAFSRAHQVFVKKLFFINFFQIFWSIGGLKVQKWAKRLITLTCSKNNKGMIFFHNYHCFWR